MLLMVCIFGFLRRWRWSGYLCVSVWGVRRSMLLLFCVFVCSCMRSLKVNLEFLPQSCSTLLLGMVSLTKPQRWLDHLANEYQGSSWWPTSPGAAGPHIVTCGLRGEWESELGSSHSHRKHCVDRTVSSALGICPNEVLSNCGCPHQPPVTQILGSIPALCK